MATQVPDSISILRVPALIPQANNEVAKVAEIPSSSISIANTGYFRSLPNHQCYDTKYRGRWAVQL